ncbi:MAG TPA: hypothetical protein VGM89_15180, partial [Puia sp.]
MLNHKFLFRCFAGLLFAGLFLAACKKNAAPSYGAPTITRVAQPLDSAGIDSGSFTQWVIIYGARLSST